MADTKPTRAEEVRTERRRKPGSIAASGFKLALNEEKLDKKTYQYRHVNDKDGRVQQLYGQDWDIAPEQAKDDTNSLGTVNSTQAGVAEGKPFNAVLMRKRKDWFEADQKEKQKRLDEMEAAIRRGADHKDHNAPAAQVQGAYTPGGANTIERI